MKRSLVFAALGAAAVVAGGEPTYAKETAADDLVWIATGNQPDVNFNGRWVVFETAKGGKVAIGTRDTKLHKTGVSSVKYARRFPSIGDTIFDLAWQDDQAEVDPLCGFPDWWLIRAGSGVGEIVSVQSRFIGNQFAGLAGDADCEYPAISGDGSRVAFESRAGNLAPGVTNVVGCSRKQVYVRDFATSRTHIVSIGNDGVAGNNDSRHAALSRTGRYVAFESYAYDLAANDKNGIPDVFLRDTFLGVTTLVSHDDGSTDPIGGIDPDISADGRFVAYTGKAPAALGSTNTVVYLRDMVDGTQVIASRANGPGGAAVIAATPSISFDGRYVSFVTPTATAAPDTVTFPVAQGIVRDMTTGENRLATRSQGPLGAPLDASGRFPGIVGTPRLSGDGRYLVFATASETISRSGKKGEVDIYMRDVWGPTGVVPDFKPPVVKKLAGPASIPQATDCTGTPPTQGTLTVRASEAAKLVVRFVLRVDNRLEEQGRLTLDVPAGDTQIPLTGCVGTDVLPKGDYYVYANLFDAGLNASKSKYRKLKIL